MYSSLLLKQRIQMFIASLFIVNFFIDLVLNKETTFAEIVYNAVEDVTLSSS